eukprot:TRINITY_DN11405_c0_g2_i2.p1 TRINITY_DN11405_c0_g2~~TRINITY_DN11405_c0_g2_i2.p1  ORF type:complete len:491 (-),score=97.21 TRINITY_DN11405_c0_g2_i2:22-1494(-)
MNEAWLSEVVIGAVLAALPPRHVPSRSFVTACFELVQSLIDAWMTAHDASSRGGKPVHGKELQLRLEELVGPACSEAWWEDAAERCSRLEKGPAKIQSQAYAEIATFLERGRSIASRSTTASSSSRDAGASGGQSWSEFGAAWILSALDDAVGSVTAHCARKAAGPAGRPATPSGLRPTTGGARPYTPNVRPGTSKGAGRHQFRPPSRAGGTGDNARPSTPQQERYRLLALKHFVGAAKGDSGLQECPIIESCLADVATGAVPHMDQAVLLGNTAFRERLHSFAQQESNGRGPEALQEAVALAMKCAVATISQTPRGKTGITGSKASKSSETGSTAGFTSGSARGARSGWLPKAFVQEFNAEGEEVEQTDPLEDVPYTPDSPTTTTTAAATGVTTAAVTTAVTTTTPTKTTTTSTTAATTTAATKSTIAVTTASPPLPSPPTTTKITTAVVTAAATPKPPKRSGSKTAENQTQKPLNARVSIVQEPELLG